MRYKLVILGSGPAGLTAAIYASRAQLDPLVVEGVEPGGQLMITSTVENFPGFPEGILGPQLMMAIREQAENFGTGFLRDHVESVDLSKRPFTVQLSEETVLADALIIATGASANWLGLESEKELRGFGVSACATCDGFFFKNQEVVVVGGGDSAMEDAIYLTRFATKVTVVHRRDQLRASRYMQEKALKNDKIQFIWNTVVTDILGTKEDGVTGIRLKNRVTGEVFDYATNGVFIAIGHTPNTQVFRGQLDMDEKGYIRTECKSTKTSVPGVFAAGDVQDSVYRQAISAAGTGCMAALDAEHFLGEQD
ncbi:MAG: thioredoxin-disulfide reductase [Calditrichaeota bacterium]|nr:thioredoxin-disulfide reductase [Calditrichota bacterium]